MRNVILAVAVALTLVAGPTLAAPRKPAPANVGNGRAAWFDITTTDMTKSKEFYGKLFDWTFNAIEGTDLAAQIVSRGTEIGSLRLAEGKISPFDGVVYIQVTDVTASCKKAVELGGTVPPGFPFNLYDRPGAIGLAVDPAGHPIGMYSRTAIPAEKPKGK